MANEIILVNGQNRTGVVPVQDKPNTETPLTDSALEFMQARKSQNTLYNYQHSMKLFREWMLDTYGLDIATPAGCVQVDQGMIANYLSYLASDERKNAKSKKPLKPLKASSILRHLSAIREFFDYVADQTGKANPTKGKKVEDVINGIQRKKGTAPKQKRAITLDVVSMMLAEIEMKDLKDIRDAAIIAFGFAGGFRRSELANVDVEHLEFRESGIMVYLPKSKTDQTGQGMWKHIAYGERKTTCPVRLVQRWIKEAGTTEGALFRSIAKGGRVGERITPHSIATIIKKRAEAAGLDSTQFSGHSLRRGYVTHAYDKGLDLFTIMQHTGHESTETVKRYVEKIDVEKKSATKGLY